MNCLPYFLKKKKKKKKKKIKMSAAVVSDALRVLTFSSRLLVELSKYMVEQLFLLSVFFLFFFFQKMAQGGQKHPKYSKCFYFLRAYCLCLLLYLGTNSL